MEKAILRQLEKLQKQEARLFSPKKAASGFKASLSDRVPKGLQDTLRAAFSKAFSLLFLKGTATIEKTFHKDELRLEHEASHHIFSQTQSKKHLKRIDKPVFGRNFLNNTLSTASGVGLGFLGIGLPDIPLFLGFLLKGIYETALSYGIAYDTQAEQVYLLRLIATALTTGEVQQAHNRRLEGASTGILAEEIQITATILSDEMLVDKFIQGLPLVGVVGGFANHRIYKQVSDFSRIKYKKRYLLSSGA